MIIKRDGRAVPFNREKIASAVYRAAVACGGRDQEEAERVTDDVLAMLEARENAGTWPTVEEVQDLRGEGPDRARPRAHGQGLHRVPLRARPEARGPGEPDLLGGEHPLPQAVGGALLGDRPGLRHAWTEHRGIVARGRVAELVAASDAFYETELDAAAARRSLERRDELRAVIVAGPSSSGKTTTTLKIRERLAAGGHRARCPLTVDNYFFDLDVHPKIGDDDYDFETPAGPGPRPDQRAPPALRRRRSRRGAALQLQDGQARRATAGSCPPRAGRGAADRLAARPVSRDDRGHAARSEVPALHRDALAGAGPRTGATSAGPTCGCCAGWCATCSSATTPRGRPSGTGTSCAASELRYIVPELRRAHAIVNSFLPYELPIMKARLQPALAPLMDEFRAGAEETQEAFERAIAGADPLRPDTARDGRERRAAPVTAARVHRRERIQLLLKARPGGTHDAACIHRSPDPQPAALGDPERPVRGRRHSGRRPAARGTQRIPSEPLPGSGSSPAWLFRWLSSSGSLPCSCPGPRGSLIPALRGPPGSPRGRHSSPCASGRR